LFLCQRVPYPPDRGDRITTWHLLRHFARRGHRLRVGCFAEGAADTVAASELAARLDAEVFAPRIDRRRRSLASLRGLLTGEALTLPFFRVGALRRQVAAWLAHDPPELAWIYSSSMAQYVLDWRGGARVMQFAELDSDKWRQYAEHRRGLWRWIYAREARLLLRFEDRVAREFDASCVVSEAERDLFRRAIPGVEPFVLRNGVDVEHFAARGDERREPRTVVFTGVMDYEPNVQAMLWFTTRCWPAIRARFPDARLWIVGSAPSFAIQALHGQNGIEVTGRVAATPPWLDRATLAIAPLQIARGVQNKVLEAMSSGLPVVASPAAAQGLGAVPADALVVAGGEEQTVASVCALLADAGRARAIGHQAARFVRERFRWENVFGQADSLIEAAVARRTEKQ
jgi:sugar transferase (PEP-CTERM/EpsH1 system associated)